MASKQESDIGEYWQEHCRITDKTEKELNIQPYCKISILRTKPDGDPEVLYVYDLPRDMVWRYEWVFEWRKAKFVCKYPRDRVRLVFSFYDRTSGLEIGYKTLLSRKVAATALLTKYRNLRTRYIEEKSKELFFEQESDEFLKKIDTKIQRAGQKLEEITSEITKTTKKIKPSQQ